jgi:hypothetical protein
MPVRSRSRRAVTLMLFAFASLLALTVSGCGAFRFGAAPTPTPDAAAILQRAGTASYHDALFTLAMSAPFDANSDIPLARGTGVITTTPARTHFTLSYPFDSSLLTPTSTPSATPSATPSITPGATPLTIEIITDAATNTAYMRTTGLPTINGVSLGDGSWSKTTVTDDVPIFSIFDVSSLTGLTELGKAKTVRLIGVETLDGAKVYHLQSSVTTTTTSSGISLSSTTASHYYVRQDNYRPVKIVANSTNQMSSAATEIKTHSTTTLTFTAYDIGVTINLPQV